MRRWNNMILLTMLLIALVILTVMALIGGASLIVMLGDVIVFVAIVAFVVKLFAKKKGA